jgi:hypothetical protein
MSHELEGLTEKEIADHYLKDDPEHAEAMRLVVQHYR